MRSLLEKKGIYQPTYILIVATKHYSMSNPSSFVIYDSKLKQ